MICSMLAWEYGNKRDEVDPDQNGGSKIRLKEDGIYQLEKKIKRQETM